MVQDGQENSQRPPLGVYNTEMSDRARRRMQQIEEERRQACQPAPRPTQNWAPPHVRKLLLHRCVSCIGNKKEVF